MGAFALIACMIWRLQPDLLLLQEEYKRKISLPPVFSGAQIRGGDKVSETTLIDAHTIIRKLGVHEGACVFILTDDYHQFLNVRRGFPQLKPYTLCQENEKG
jgi:hypothetical protein